MKRKITVRIILVLAILLSLVSPAAYASANKTGFKLAVVPGNISVDGTTTLTISGAGIKNMYACEVVVQFDTDRVKFVSGKGFGVQNAVIGKGNQVTFASTKSGKQRGVSGNIKLCKLSFKGKSTGTARFVLKSVKIMDTALKETNYVASESAEIQVNPAKDDKHENSKGDNKGDKKSR